MLVGQVLFGNRLNCCVVSNLYDGDDDDDDDDNNYYDKHFMFC